MKLLFLSALVPLVAAFDVVTTVPVSPTNQVITPFDSQDFCSLSITDTCNTTIAYIDTANAQLRPALSQLVRRSYFKYYKLNLYKSCPYWKDEGFCVNRNCAVDFIEDWDSLNDTYQPAQLGSFYKADSANSDSEDDVLDKNYCYLEDDMDLECQVVSLVDNPERFTGYGGAQSAQIWNYIYRENCFPDTTHMSENQDGATCVEKRLFYRLVSGMHASIAVHLSHEYLNTKTGAFAPNLRLFMNRVGNFNDRLANVYFNYAIVSQAVAKLLNHPEFSLPQTNDHPHNPAYIEEILDVMKTQLSGTLNQQQLFDDSSLFRDPSLKDEFRDRFRNVSSIMDCVGCDRCRLWGKIQTTGYGTALKVLFEMEAEGTAMLGLKKQEVVALINTFDRLSKSVAAINNFKVLYLESFGEGGEKGNRIEFPFQAVSGVDSDAESDEKSQPNRKKTSKKNNPYLKQSHITAKSKSNLKSALNQEIATIWEALKFIGRSYLYLPQLLYQNTLFYTSIYWNWFMGNYEY
ncbi:hypothetical protein BABINDRAFT_53570, partial [Babjeviella inositovora NRRL Y-12698]